MGRVTTRMVQGRVGLGFMYYIAMYLGRDKRETESSTFCNITYLGSESDWLESLRLPNLKTS